MKHKGFIEDTNPRVQCLICGKWKRLLNKDKLQMFFPCVNKDCKYYSEGRICTDCCDGNNCITNKNKE